MRAAAVLFFSICLGTIFGGSVIAQSVMADLVILNGDVWTMNEKQRRAEAIAIAGNKIIDVGNNDQIKKYVSNKTTVIDAEGELVLPGFNDAHVHFMAIGNKFSSLDLKEIAKADELYERIREYVRSLPKGRWILGSGGSNELWEQINGEMLDEISPENPVFIYNADPRSAVTNTSALKIAGIKTAGSGVIRSTEFQRMIRTVPNDHMKRWSEIAETASNYAASLGVTSVQDMHSDDQTAIYRELEKLGKLKTRVYDCSQLSDWAKNPTVAANDSPMVRGGCLKGFHNGDEEWTPTLRKDILAADKAGRNIAIHAIGGNTTSWVLNIFDHAIKANGKRDRRFRIEHAEGIRNADVVKYGSLGIVASIQPYLFGNGAGYASGYYDQLKNAGFITAVGSDAPMLGFDPLLAVLSVNKDDRVEQVIKDHTLTAAYAEFQEAVKGSLEKGKLADIVIIKKGKENLSKEVISRRNMILEKVITTIVDGKVVYQAKL